MSKSAEDYTVPLVRMLTSPIPINESYPVGTTKVVQTSSEDGLSLYLERKVTDPEVKENLDLYSLGACIETDTGRVMWATLYPKAATAHNPVAKEKL